MVRGRFGDTTGRPYIEAGLVIPSLGCYGLVSFLFDTGADVTTLMPLDGTRLQVDYDLLKFDVPVGGIGGSANCAAVEANIVFPSDDSIYSYGIDLTVYERDEELVGLPSLLGRDVIDQWRVTYDRRNGMLLAEDENFDPNK